MLLKRFYDPERVADYNTRVDEEIGRLWEKIDRLLQTGRVSIRAGQIEMPAGADASTRAAVELIRDRKLSDPEIKNKARDLVPRPPVIGIRVLSAKDRQHFSPNLIQQGTMQGWLTLGQGKIVLHEAGGQDHVYQIERTPGYYCCHCDDPIENAGHFHDGIETVGRRHARDCGGLKSPDPQNPSGYRRDNFYACVKEG